MPLNIEELIDISKERLEELVEEPEDEVDDRDDYAFPNLPSLKGDFEHLKDDEIPEEADDDSEDEGQDTRKSKRLNKRSSEEGVVEVNLLEGPYKTLPKHEAKWVRRAWRNFL